jgi:hypothetical protein
LYNPQAQVNKRGSQMRLRVELNKRTCS